MQVKTLYSKIKGARSEVRYDLELFLGAEGMLRSITALVC